MKKQITKKEIQPKFTKEKERYSFTKNNITLVIEIDYKKNLISILENDFYQNPKKFIFSNRGVEYMQGWLNILDVIKEAITDAKLRYEKELAERSRFKEKMVFKVLAFEKNIKK